MRSYAEQMSSLHGVALRYLKRVTSSNFWSFILIYALMLFVLLAMILLFSVLTFISYVIAHLRVCWRGLKVHYFCRLCDRCRPQIFGCVWTFHL